MFTGLVRALGTVNSLSSGKDQRTLEIEICDGVDELRADSARRYDPLAIGASIAVSGVCLTVTRAQGTRFAADVAFESLRVTTLGGLVPGSRVNLEPSLRVGDPLGGHWVTGHVDGLARVRSIEARDDARACWFDAPAHLQRLIASKGSVCVDGVSLTINDVDEDGFSVALVPHTLAVTTLGRLREGAVCNLEVDIVARYLARWLETKKLGAIQVTATAATTREDSV